MNPVFWTIGFFSLPFLYITTPIGYRAMVILLAAGLWVLHPIIASFLIVSYSIRNWIGLTLEILLVRKLGIFDSPERAAIRRMRYYN